MTYCITEVVLHISTNLLDEIKLQAESSSDECCGFVLGHDTSTSRVVTRVMPVLNRAQTDKRFNFAIAPEDYLLAERFAEQQQLQLLGIYHSHPEHSAFPSDYDRLLALPYFSYIIVSVLNKVVDDVRSWHLNEYNFFEEEEIKQLNHSCNL